MALIVTLTEMQDYLQVSGSVSLLNMYATYSQSEVEAYIDRRLSQAVVSGEILHYDNSDYSGIESTPLSFYEKYQTVFTDNYPIAGLVVTSGGDTISASSLEVDIDNGTIKMYGSPSDYKDNLQATYTYGYTDVTAPPDLKLAVLEGVRYMYQNRGQASAGKRDVNSKKIKDFSVTYEKQSIETGKSYLKRYLAENSNILNRYMRISL